MASLSIRGFLYGLLSSLCVPFPIHVQEAPQV